MATEDKRKKLINAAKTLFFQQGYDRTSLDEIIAVAGGSKQTIYRFFGGKQGLFCAVIETITDQYKGVYTIHEAPLENYEQELENFARQYLQIVVGDEGRNLARVVISHSLHSGDVAEKFLELGPDRALKLADYFDRLVAAGKLQMDNTLLTAQQWLGALRGDYQIRRLVDPEYQCSNREIKQAAGHATTMLIRACATDE